MHSYRCTKIVSSRTDLSLQKSIFLPAATYAERYKKGYTEIEIFVSGRAGIGRKQKKMFS